VLEEYRYAGTTPLIVQAATPGWLYRQAGRAIGVGQHPAAPSPAFATANMTAREIVLGKPNEVERETTWRFEFLYPTQQDYVLPSSRDDSHGFYGV